MERLKMQTPNIADDNFQKLAALFPNAVTEIKNENGEIIRAIDADVLRREISAPVVEGSKERYQFTWPDKNLIVHQASQEVKKTLRLLREKSAGKDGTPGSIDTENIYIEGDNLDALKILRTTYRGKVKMIYIDPPYNTGHDFVYDDDFSQAQEEYYRNSGQFNFDSPDEKGGRLVQNLESNGRFHTDWLNMIYPRLKIARDFLSDDGVLFISIDDNEQANLKKICDEIFNVNNFVACFPWRKRTAKSDVPFGVSQDYEWILVYAKSNNFKAAVEGGNRKYYETPDFPGRPWRTHDMTKQTTASERPNSFFTMINPKNGKEYPCDPNRTWRITKDTFQKYYDAGEIIFPGDYDFLRISKPVARYFKDNDIKKAGDDFGKITVSTKLPDNIGMSLDGTKEIVDLFGDRIFNFPKNTKLMKFLVNIATDSDSIIMDFFSGSATTAHAVMKLNAEDGGKRKFILVQIEEDTPENSEARKAGYKTICEIGEERIRRAAAKIREEYPIAAENLDLGFRVFRVDSSNMKEVFYRPDEFQQDQLEFLADNIKEDRTPEDLLFQVMPEFDIPLSAEIKSEIINGQKVFTVAEGYLIACFDSDITEETVKAIAQRKPYYAVFRDSGMSGDSVITNFEQIFETYSPETTRKIL